MDEIWCGVGVGKQVIFLDQSYRWSNVLDFSMHPLSLAQTLRYSRFSFTSHAADISIFLMFAILSDNN